MSFFQCGHQKGSLVDKNHKEISKFSDIRLIFWHFLPFFHTKIKTPSNWKKCSKGCIATIVITGYYHWRINFFFENQLTSGGDTGKFFLRINAPGINVWNIQNSEKILKNSLVLCPKNQNQFIWCLWHEFGAKFESITEKRGTFIH